MDLRKLLTEFIGTFFLVLIIGFAVTAKNHDMAPLAIGAGLMALVYMGGHSSGAHYNPAVSLAVLIRGKMAVADFVAYVITQIIGAIVAAMVVHLIHPGMFAVSVPVTQVTFSNDDTHEILKALLVEFIFTFALALVVVNVATAPKNAGNSFYGLAIGFIVTAGAWAVGSVSGAAFNPAVATGPNLVGWIHHIATGGEHAAKSQHDSEKSLAASEKAAQDAAKPAEAGYKPMQDLWVYWGAPLAGGLLAGIVCNFQCGGEAAKKPA